MVPYHAEIRFCYVTMLLSNTLPTPTTTVFWRTMGWFQGLTFHYSPQKKKKHFLIKILFVCVLCVYVCGTRHPEGQRAILGVHPRLPPCLKTALFSGVCHCVYIHHMSWPTALPWLCLPFDHRSTGVTDVGYWAWLSWFRDSNSGTHACTPSVLTQWTLSPALNFKKKKCQPENCWEAKAPSRDQEWLKPPWKNGWELWGIKMLGSVSEIHF